MPGSTHLVVTSINGPGPAMQALAEGALAHGWKFHIVGDQKSPGAYKLDGAQFHDLAAQRASGFAYAAACPTNTYARKNIGYLMAIRDGAAVIVETDDDNSPYDGFFAGRSVRQQVPVSREQGWTNLYRHFTDENIWPRGFPLDEITAAVPAHDSLPVERVVAPIQMALADGDPDVDAVHRLVLSLDVTFSDQVQVALAAGSWCPFNSQNTSWWPQAFPLAYLPAHCPFRMSDIWRGFVAQRVAFENGWTVLFDRPSVHQVRNAHDLMADFTSEVPGYLGNRKLVAALEALQLRRGFEHIGDNLRLCYDRLIALDMVGRKEADLLELWLSDLAAL
jgi:hypothetical protein